MRVEFSNWMEKKGQSDQDTIFLTGDLGFNALENVREVMGDRFVNAGVSEQNMISMAAAIAHSGLRPFCYSIAPFATFRPCEQIRLDVCIHNKNVKIVGNGGGYGYGIMGATHHALEDIAVLSSFPNMKCFIPYSSQSVDLVCDELFAYNGPSYLRLGYGNEPNCLLPEVKGSIKKIFDGEKLTVVALGPVVLNALEATSEADVFVVTEIPFVLSDELRSSINRTKRLLVIEEHTSRGGMGELLFRELYLNNIFAKSVHLHAKGYPDGKYGSQKYHQEMSGLDNKSIDKQIRLLMEK